MPLPPAVMAVDPGGVTGIARYERGTGFSAGEWGFRDACDRIAGSCAHWRGSLAVLWERYDIMPRLPQQDAHLALEVIGVTRYLAAVHGCRVLPPARQHTPGPRDRERLAALGWWPGGKDAQSAAAHLLNWMMKTGSLPPGLAVRLAGLRAAR